MPKITKCYPIKECTLKNKCFRYFHRDFNLFQDFSQYMNDQNVITKCNSFMPSRKEKRK